MEKTGCHTASVTRRKEWDLDAGFAFNSKEEEYFMAILERTFGHDEDPFEDTGLADFFEFVEN